MLSGFQALISTFIILFYPFILLIKDAIWSNFKHWSILMMCIYVKILGFVDTNPFTSAYKHQLNLWLTIILFEVKAIWCFVNDMKLELWGGLMVFYFSTYVIQQTHDFNEDRIYHSFTLLSSTVGPSRGCWFIKLIGSFSFSLYYLATFWQLFWVYGTYNVVIMKHNNHKR